MARVCILLMLVLPFYCYGQKGRLSDVTHQHLFDTLPFLDTHYDRLTELFNTQEPVECVMVFLGNSITEGGDWAKLTGNDKVLNRGIGGDITFGVLRRLDEVIRHAPTKVFILIGINDIAKDIPPEVIAHNCGEIISRIKHSSPGTGIYLQSILPVNPAVRGFPQHYDKANAIVRTNLLLAEVAKSQNVNFLDLYPLFLDKHQHLDEHLTNDGLHLNATGYQRWADF